MLHAATSAPRVITWSRHVTSGSISRTAPALVRSSRTGRPSGLQTTPRSPPWNRQLDHSSTDCRTCRCQPLPVSSDPTRLPVYRIRSTTSTRCRRPPACQAVSAEVAEMRRRRKLIFRRWRQRTAIRWRATWEVGHDDTPPTSARARWPRRRGSCSRPTGRRTSTAVQCFRCRWAPLPPSNRCRHLPPLPRRRPLPSSIRGWLLSVSQYRSFMFRSCICRFTCVCMRVCTLYSSWS